MKRLYRRAEMPRYLLALPIALIWISVILVHTRGGLLVGGDWTGYYDAYSAISTGIPQAIIFGITLLLSLGNIYIGFYIALFIGILINLTALSYFLEILFPEWKRRKLPYIIAYVLYTFNMFSLYNTFKSVIAISFINIAGLLVFLAQAIKLYRYIMSTCTFTKLDSILMGTGIALSSGVPPNSFRILFMESIILIGLLALALLMQSIAGNLHWKENLKKLTVKLPFTITIAIIGMLYWIIPFFSSFYENIGTFAQVYEVRGYNVPKSEPYASLINTFRVLGVWAFLTAYNPYHDLYFHDPLITITSFLWPAYALALSLILASRAHRLKILLLVTLSLAVISWDTADNPPVGLINTFIRSHVPLLPGLFPTYFLSGTLLPLIFITLSTYTLTRFFELSKKRLYRGGNILLILLLLALLIPTMPFFTGEALGQYFNTSVRGIWIPQDYFNVKNMLSKIQPEGLVLFWPSVATYIRTSWNYQGGANFYNSFFSPINIITPQNPVFKAGGYALYTSASQYYFLLTTPPIMPDQKSAFQINLSYNNMQIWGAKYQLVDENLTLYDIKGNNIDIYLPFDAHLNASTYHFFLLKMKPAKTITSLIEKKRLWIGIAGNGTVGWYIIGGITSRFSIIDGDEISIAMNIGSPDKPWASSVYDPGYVTGIVIRIIIQGSSLYMQKLSLEIVSLSMTHSEIDQSILTLWKRYGIEYLLIDRSIIEGAMVDPKIYSLSIDTLIKHGIIEPVFKGKYLELYRIKYE